MENHKTYKLCFYCDHFVTENDRIVIDSITHVGLEYNITNRHKKKLDIISDASSYEPHLMHSSCCDKIATNLGFGEGQH